MGKTARIVALALVFSGSQLIQELLSEAIFTKYELQQSMGEISLVYAFFQHIGTLGVAYLRMNDEVERAHTPPEWRLVCVLSLLVFASTTLANWAVEYVYYPAKVVAKSAKLVPTMVVAVLMGNAKNFSLVDYLSAILLSAGAAGFALSSGRVVVDPAAAALTSTTVGSGNGMMEGEVGSKTLVKDLTGSGTSSAASLVEQTAWIGLTMLTIATSADALVPNMQQKMMRDGASAEQVAWRVNLIGALALFSCLFLYGVLGDWISLFIQDSQVFVVMVSAGCMLGVAVLSYTMLIEEAGSVVAVGVGTVRKAMTLFLSYTIFPGEGKDFTFAHILSVLAVVVGMGLSPMYKRYVRDRGRSGEAGGASSSSSSSSPTAGSNTNGVSLSSGGGGTTKAGGSVV